MRCIRGSEQPIAERVEIVMIAVAGIEERDVGRAQATALAKTEKQHVALHRVMTSEEPARGLRGGNEER